MKRIIEPELLDELPADNPLAIRSRRDLCRVNAWMRHPTIMAGALRNHLNGRATGQIIELGAGDGNFLLGVARRLAPRWPQVNVALLDRQQIVPPQTLEAFTALGWPAETVTRDVLDWLQTDGRMEIAVANLFLHHFPETGLKEMFRAIASRARLFIAIEPRRARWPLLCSRLLWAIGCNRVTQHDAVISVRAGFFGNELSELWPDRPNWQLTEQCAGPFSHLFIAQKIQRTA